MDTVVTLGLIIAGLLVGYVLLQRLTKKDMVVQWLDKLIFSIILPYVVITEIAHTELSNSLLIVLGMGFVFGFYYLGRLFKWDVHRSALLATAEGGTLGFVLFVLIGTEDIARFLMVDMIGNGVILFTFIYSRVTGKTHFVDFIQNPLMIAVAVGFILNFAHVDVLSSVHFAKEAQPFLIGALILLISVSLGSKVGFAHMQDIVRSKPYWIFWLVRSIVAIGTVVLHAPIALTILCILPPSFLLPIMYKDEVGREHGEYASNFIGASLPMTAVLAAILIYII